MEINTTIALAGTFIGGFALLIILLKHHRNPYQKGLFMLFVFSLGYVSLLSYLINSRKILEVPHLYRTASPFMYTISITLFLLARSIRKKQQKPSWKDLAWFALPLLHILELLPFFLRPASDKLEVLQNLNTDLDAIFSPKNGLLPDTWHYWLQFAVGTLLFGQIFLTTLKYRNTGKRNTRVLNLVWINRISLFLGACFAYLLILLMTGIGNLQVYALGTLVFGSVLIIIFFSLFLEPHILYGSLGTKQERKKTLQKRVQTTRFTPEEQHFQNALERYFREETDYLKPEFRQQDLAERLGLSRNTISYLINKIYQKNFNQLINEKRIEIAQQYMQSERWQHLSLGGIAREVGFKSRTTFNKAFKNKTGLTPSEFKNA